MEQALEALRDYLNRPKEAVAPRPHAEDAGKDQVAPVDAAEITPVLADLALRTGHKELARTLFVQDGKENPESPAAIAGLGAARPGGGPKSRCPEGTGTGDRHGISQSRTHISNWRP